MSRSFRKTSIISITSSDSDKQDKQIYNRRMRRSLKVSVRLTDEIDLLCDKRNYSQKWTFAKEGKHYFNKNICNGKYMRK